MTGQAAEYVPLGRDTNQARGIARYAIEMVNHRHRGPGRRVLDKVEQFHRDSVACAVSAIAQRANAPLILREDAWCYAGNYPDGVSCFGSTTKVPPEKAIAANCSAVREWDANGTNFGFNPAVGNTRGEFGHNDFYPVAVAAAQIAGCDGKQTLHAMVCLDEIRGRLAEAFALRDYKIDHVVHGAIASAAVYGAMLGATVDQIESAIGTVVAHYIPFRAIRHGTQLSDSKGASAALSAEVAVTAMRRALRGFVGPADIFRNPQAIFCLFEAPEQLNSSPFDLRLCTGGDDFAVMDMHFKIGLYEHQSAGAIQGLIDVLSANPQLLDDVAAFQKIRISIYQPAFGIIGDPAKRNPRTRQSADHSMLYIIATVLRKAVETRATDWETLMLLPKDYDEQSLFHQTTRQLMEKIEILHGGPEFDRCYPDGIPTTLEIEHASYGTFSSGLVMYPQGHARNQSDQLDKLLAVKFRHLAGHGVSDIEALHDRFSGWDQKSVEQIQTIYEFKMVECD